VRSARYSRRYRARDFSRSRQHGSSYIGVAGEPIHGPQPGSTGERRASNTREARCTALIWTDPRAANSMITTFLLRKVVVTALSSVGPPSVSDSPRSELSDLADSISDDAIAGRFVQALSENLVRILPESEVQTAVTLLQLLAMHRFKGVSLDQLVTGLYVMVGRFGTDISEEARLPAASQTPSQPPAQAKPVDGRTLSAPPLPTPIQKSIRVDRNHIYLFYATDRKKDGNLTTTGYLNGRSDRENLHYGECHVSLPGGHRIGEIERPSAMGFNITPNPARHVMVTQIVSFTEEVFLKRLNQSILNSASTEAFVFVHGYNVSFDSAALRTAQLARDLDFVGTAIFYSWPAGGWFTSYVKAETEVHWSFPHFKRFVRLLVDHSGASRIHVIAHSMGARAVFEAIRSLESEVSGSVLLNEVVFAAPDIDADSFRESSTSLKNLTRRITLYASSNDRALQASTRIHGYPRAGEPLLIIPGIDTIDASNVDTDFLGHSYFSESWPLLSDIHSVLLRDDPPGRRFGLTEMRHADGTYYMFRL